MKKNQHSTLEAEIIQVKREKAKLKSKWSNAFINDLNVILEKCFVTSKTKKEHFITKDKIELELIKLLQSQKNFLCRKDFATVLKSQGVFDKIDSVVAKINYIDMVWKKVDALTIYEKKIKRDFEEVIFFDIYSIEFASVFEQQRRVNDAFNYNDTYKFLTYVEKPLVQKIANYFTLPFIKKKLKADGELEFENKTQLEIEFPQEQ